MKSTDYLFKNNDTVIVTGKATIAKVTASYQVEIWHFYSLDKYPGFLVREDCLDTWDGLKHKDE